MPRTRQPPVRRDDSQLQRRPIVRALGAEAIHLAVNPEDEDLAALNVLDLRLDLVEVPDAGQGRDVLEPVFLCHPGDCR